MIMELLHHEQKRKSFLQIAIYLDEGDSPLHGIALHSSPLHIAAAFRLSGIIPKLLWENHQPLARDSKGNSALSLAAARKDNWYTIQHLQTHASVDDASKIKLWGVLCVAQERGMRNGLIADSPLGGQIGSFYLEKVLNSLAPPGTLVRTRKTTSRSGLNKGSSR